VFIDKEAMNQCSTSIVAAHAISQMARTVIYTQVQRVLVFASWAKARSQLPGKIQ
jgi:hypothetical protein